MAIKTPFVLWEILQPRKFDSQAKIGGLGIAERVNWREHLVPTVGPDKTRSQSQSC